MASSVWAFWAAQGSKEKKQFEFFLSTFSTFLGPLFWNFVVSAPRSLHKSRGGQFLWNINWYLGWFWAGWQYWKKVWADYEQFLRAVFSCFHWQKKSLNYFYKYCSVCSKKLHKISFFNIFWGQNRLLLRIWILSARVKSTQYKKLVPNALLFTYQNLKSCKPHEKTKQKTSNC